MRKQYLILKSIASLLALIILTGCSESTNYTTIPSFVIEKKLDVDNILTAVTEVTGEYNERAKITIRDILGDMVTIELNANNPEEYDIFVSDNFQKLNIYFISMVPPTHFVPGTVHIECDFTDDNGNGLYIFNGLIAAWTLD